MRFRGISKFLIRMPKKLDAAFPKDGLILQCKKNTNTNGQQNNYTGISMQR